LFMIKRLKQWNGCENIEVNHNKKCLYILDAKFLIIPYRELIFFLTNLISDIYPKLLFILLLNKNKT
jgi:hypothetical protein